MTFNFKLDATINNARNKSRKFMSYVPQLPSQAIQRRWMAIEDLKNRKLFWLNICF